MHKEKPPEPTEEEFSIYMKVRRFLSWKANKVRAEGMTPEKREILHKNLAKARAVLAEQRLVDKANTQD